jgi:hypothetical protein
MSLLARVIREPLVHFLLIGVAVFALYAYVTGDDPSIPQRDRIVVTEGRVQQLAQIFTRTWQRAPTMQELHGLINAYVNEEVYYREALKLGLDRDDTLIRRRMQQKLEFLTEPPDGALTPTDAELEAFLAANRSDFFVEPQFAFQQIFIKPDTDDGPDRIARILGDARSAPLDADFRVFGDRTLLPNTMPLAPLTIIDRSFGEGFGKQLVLLPSDKWSGPVRSPFGIHLVRIIERRDGYDPALSDVRKAVELEWQAAKRETFRQAEYQRLRDKYDVILPDASTGNQTAESIK